MFVRVVGPKILTCVNASLYLCKTGYFIIRIIRWALLDEMRLIHTSFQELAQGQS